MRGRGGRGRGRGGGRGRGRGGSRGRGRGGGRGGRGGSGGRRGGARARGDTTTLLPASLRDETATADYEGDTKFHYKIRRPRGQYRKADRKRAKEEKKARKAEHHARVKVSSKTNAKRAAAAAAEEAAKAKARAKAERKAAKAKARERRRREMEITEAARAQDPLRRGLAEDDQEIKKIEKMLGIKSKKKAKGRGSSSGGRRSKGRGAAGPVSDPSPGDFDLLENPADYVLSGLSVLDEDVLGSGSDSGRGGRGERGGRGHRSTTSSQASGSKYTPASGSGSGGPDDDEAFVREDDSDYDMDGWMLGRGDSDYSDGLYGEDGPLSGDEYAINPAEFMTEASAGASSSSKRARRAARGRSGGDGDSGSSSYSSGGDGGGRRGQLEPLRKTAYSDYDSDYSGSGDGHGGAGGAEESASGSDLGDEDSEPEVPLWQKRAELSSDSDSAAVAEKMARRHDTEFLSKAAQASRKRKRLSLYGENETEVGASAGQGSAKRKRLNNGTSGGSGDGSRGRGSAESAQGASAATTTTTTTTTASVGKYIPPHLRRANGAAGGGSVGGGGGGGGGGLGRGSDDQATAAVARAMRGYLNKLTVDTIAGVAADVEALYASHPTSIVSSVLADLIVRALTKGNRVNARLVATYGGLITMLHVGVGVEVGAKVVDVVVESFDTFYGLADKDSCIGLLRLLSSLVIYKVTTPGVVYDYIREFVDSMTSLDVELLLVLLSSCGAELRSSDPAALKDIVLLITQRAKTVLSGDGGEGGEGGGDSGGSGSGGSGGGGSGSDGDGSSSGEGPGGGKSRVGGSGGNSGTSGPSGNGKGLSSSRVEFMLATISDLKNNRRTVTAEAKAAEPVHRAVRVALKADKGRSSHVTSLVLSLDQVRETGKRGHWWNRGAERQDWAHGQQQRDEQEGGGGGSGSGLASTTRTPAHLARVLAKADTNISALASQQRMNTQVRKAIFASLITSEDYMDAFERLMKLNLKSQQEREIVHVIIHCCIQERKFNPFYVHLARKLITFDFNYKITFQYSFWDKFKLLDRMEFRRQYNLATLLCQMLMNFSISLSILKAVEFESLPESHVAFFKLLFCSLFADGEKEVVKAMFKRVVGKKDLMFLQTGLAYFLSTHVVDKAILPRKVSDRAERARLLRQVTKRASRAVSTLESALIIT